MEQFKRAQVIMLPTNNESLNSVCCIRSDKPFLMSEQNSPFKAKIYDTKDLYHTYFNLYIISDDEIKEGDWYLNSLNTYTIHQHFKNEKLPTYGVRKIIASDNKSLTNYSVKSNPNSGETTYVEAIPQPSQQFIERFIESYNAGQVITDVLVEYMKGITIVDELQWENNQLYLKINPKDNTITIKKLKDSWNREEITKILLDRGISKEWIEQNL